LLALLGVHHILHVSRIRVNIQKCFITVGKRREITKTWTVIRMMRGRRRRCTVRRDSNG
jgi:hypothetical protein